jgi:hypothetical protein
MKKPQTGLQVGGGLMDPKTNPHRNRLVACTEMGE